MFKKDMTPLSKGGAMHKHKGKGSQMSGMPDRQAIKGLASPGSTMNDYAKASPMPNGVSNVPSLPFPGAGSG